MIKKPSQKFKDLESLYNWIQVQFEKAGTSSLKKQIQATYEVVCLYQPDSNEWEILVGKTQATDDFRKVIDTEIDCCQPAAIGVTVTFNNGTISPFMCYKITDQHIDIFDGKPKIAATATEKREESKRSDLAGIFGNETLGRIAELDKDNLRIDLGNKMVQAEIIHQNQMALKERDLHDIQSKYDELLRENSDLKSRIGELEAENDDLQGELDEANAASANDTQSLLLGLASDFLANKGFKTDGLNGYLASRSAEQPVAELPQATVETDDSEPTAGEKQDAQLVANWLRNLPALTREEMLEIMKQVERNPRLTRRILAYIDHLKEKARKQQIAEPVAEPQPPQVDDNEADNINGNDDEEDKYYGTI